MDIFPFARDFQDNLSVSSVQNQTKATLLAAMADALALGNRTCNISIVADAGFDITNVIEVLRDQGFIVTSSGGFVTVAW